MPELGQRLNENTRNFCSVRPLFSKWALLETKLFGREPTFTPHSSEYVYPHSFSY